MTDLAYPIGRFRPPPRFDASTRALAIASIAEAPLAMRRAIAGLSEEQLNAPYRPEGWTVRQVVHHVADSHMNAYVRWKLALTEDAPTIKPYDENAWASLPDTVLTPVETSTRLIQDVHERWLHLMRSMQPDEFARAYIHPQLGRNSLDFMAALYAWHGAHHVAHITALRSRAGW
jgi:uncharacterized damage-inducible protein DinB